MNEEQLARLGIHESWLLPLNETFERFNINTPLRQACFLGQCAHESGHFKFLEENLNYKADALMRVWPKRFNHELAQECAHNPERIANVVYADRMGNGDSESGDGYAYRGRGLIQLTGKTNYDAFGNAMGMDVLENPDYLSTPEGACLSAGWFWEHHGLNELADQNELEQMTKRINGGTLGLQERAALMQQALDVLSA
jgi:putative chitinase